MKGARDTDEERFGSRVLHCLAERPFWRGGRCGLGRLWGVWVVVHVCDVVIAGCWCYGCVTCIDGR